MYKKTQILSNQTIWDVANINYGGFDNIMTLIPLNAGLVNINVNLENFVAKQIIYDDVYYTDQTPQIQLSAPKAVDPIQSSNGFEYQNIFDVALMKYGDLGMTLKLIQDSGISSINDISAGGK